MGAIPKYGINIGLDWKQAEEYLKEKRRQYTERGVSGMDALQLVINPLLIRYENGERTTDLFNVIMSLV